MGNQLDLSQLDALEQTQQDAVKLAAFKKSKRNSNQKRVNNTLSPIIKKINRRETCLDDKVDRRVCTWECTETAWGAKRTSCCVKRALL